MIMDTNKCLKVANGKICSMKNDGELTSLIADKDLKQEDLAFKNGNRKIITDKNDNWLFTVIRYNDGDRVYVVT